MAMELTGRVIKLLAEQTGTGTNGEWKRRDFVVETDDQYPKKACFSAWAARVADVANLNEGDKVKVSFDVNSREYNEKWYNDLRPWKIEKVGEGSAPAAPAGQPVSEGDAFAAGPEAGDDLPF